ncbi:hypothetical protein A2954_00495 [Candidatus Roizmanbacteria bacterium RIFCSPLOWO2_01_FULL_37_12]|uniref:Uncharacterized protein n=1 Tax=Candidatus Roizmanbacteria bacterium RIFCSPLOWO2_01_FULL_37_12 TaxID=1802056 RepID=A0A1F7I9S5_9BACT|nr:MAG: hypothetical protein A3D76_00850 [Candidatus Roizmanbacteria bacterium RIFCSPHIGHO2_02_FULL_37_9b]OGK40106.1 MAG: hypothetical protein A2954_00495 [Candidatus Roizmanbacteria bacterium RIFCSPLOWO2_01_FULL_37_12]
MNTFVEFIRTTKLHKKWWGILLLLTLFGLLPFIITYFIWVKKDWNKEKKLLTIVILWIVMIAGFQIFIVNKSKQSLSSGQRKTSVQNIKNEQQEAVEQKNKIQPTVAKNPDPTKPFNENLGTSFLASTYAQKLLDVSNVAPGYIKSVFVEVSPDNKDRESVVSVFIQVKIDSSLWSGTNDDSKKDFVSAYLVSARKEFPKAFPHVYISNELREVAVGELSMSGDPKITLR